MNAEGYKTEYLKYPIYTQEPAGPIINNYLREGNAYSLTPREAQLLYVLDRTQYESTLKQKLNLNEDGQPSKINSKPIGRIIQK